MKNRRRKIVVYGFALLLLTCTTVVARTKIMKRKRRWAVRPLNRNRDRLGHFATLVKYLKTNDKEQFFKYTRLTPELFDQLLNLVSDYLQKSSKTALSPQLRLVMTLHYLSQGPTMQDLAWNYYVGKATVHCIIRETCKILWDQLVPLYLKAPVEKDFQNVATGYLTRWNMPNCIGALDGKHIQIQCPKHSGSAYFSYKKSFSIVLMASCDAGYSFNMVDIGAAGANHDCQIFRQSIFGQEFLKKRLPIPAPKALPGTSTVMPHFLVADQAFPLHENIMRPYPGEHLNDTKKIFNYRLSRARRCIENAFGVLVQRWRILRKTIIADVTTCEEIVKATVVLHNFIIHNETLVPEQDRLYLRQAGYDERETHQLGSLNRVGRVGANNAPRNIQANRDNLAEYFISPAGSVPWQMDRIYLGSIP